MLALSTTASAIIVSYLLWTFYIHPTFFSFLRNIPTLRADWRFRSYRWLYTEPNPEQLDEWLERTPHHGLVRYYGVLGAPRIMPLSPKAVREVLVTKVYGGHFERPPLNRQRFSAILGNGLFVMEGDVHKTQKKHLLPAFSPQNIKELYPTFWAKACQLTESITKKVTLTASASKDSKNNSDHPIEIVQYTSLAALDVIGLAVWGKDFDSLEKPNSEFVTRYHNIFRGSPRANRQAKLINAAALIFPMQTLRRLFPCEYFDNLAKGRLFIHIAVNDAIKEKRSQQNLKRDETKTIVLGSNVTNRRKDILSQAMSTSVIPDDLLAGHMTNFLAAGHETSSLAVTWTCFHLSKHPNVQAKLRQEIRSSLPSPSSGKDITYEALEDLPYLKAVIRESLRIFPPAPLLRREAMSDTSIAGYPIPQGTGVILSPWHINRNRYEWGPDADEFKVDRWFNRLDGNPPNKPELKPIEDLVSSASHFAYVPFLAGPRSCIGESFAKGEVSAMLAALVGRFEMTLEHQDPGYMPKVLWMTSTKPLGLRFRLRIVEGW